MNKNSFLYRKLARMERKANFLQRQENGCDAEIAWCEHKIKLHKKKKRKLVEQSGLLWGFIHRLNDILGAHQKAEERQREEIRELNKKTIAQFAAELNADFDAQNDWTI